MINLFRNFHHDKKVYCDDQTDNEKSNLDSKSNSQSHSYWYYFWYTRYVPKLFEVWTTGINSVIGGQCYGWNAGLSIGFWGYAIGQLLMGIAFINLVLSIAEICSTTSFSGGSYGMTRVVLGFYMGFIVAAFELMEYITYISTAALYSSKFICDQMDWNMNLVPLICFGFFSFIIIIVAEGNHLYWRVNNGFAIVCILIVIWYCFGSLAFVDFGHYAPLGGGNRHDNTATSTSQWFRGDMSDFLQVMPLMTWGFGGIESVALFTDIIDNPRINMSYGITVTALTLFCTMIAVLFIAASLPPGIEVLQDAPFFMDKGFGLMGLGPIASHWVLLPSQVAAAGGFFVPAARLYQSISESSLLPPFLQVHAVHETEVVQENSTHHHQQHHDTGDDDVHDTNISNNNTNNHKRPQMHNFRAVLYVSCFSYLLCIIGFYVPEFDMTNIPILLSQFVYLSDLYAYHQLKTKFCNSQTDQTISNPFGVYGCYFAAVMFILCAIGVIAFQKTFVAVIFCSVFLVFLSAYYFYYAKQHQVFSEEEQKKLLVLHVIKNNRQKRVHKVKAKHHKAHQGSHAGGSVDGRSDGGKESSSNWLSSFNRSGIQANPSSNSIMSSSYAYSSNGVNPPAEVLHNLCSQSKSDNQVTNEPPIIVSVSVAASPKHLNTNNTVNTSTTSQSSFDSSTHRTTLLSAYLQPKARLATADTGGGNILVNPPPTNTMQNPPDDKDQHLPNNQSSHILHNDEEAAGRERVMTVTNTNSNLLSIDTDHTAQIQAAIAHSPPHGRNVSPLTNNPNSHNYSNSSSDTTTAAPVNDTMVSITQSTSEYASTKQHEDVSEIFT